MLMLAFVFQTLSRRKPELDTGIYAYAKAGFGNYLGFALGGGLLDRLLPGRRGLPGADQGHAGPVLPGLRRRHRPAVAILSASLLFWGVHFLILRGIKEAAALNTIATVAKIVPIAVFMVVAVAGLQALMSSRWNFWGGEERSLSTLSRARSATRCW